MKESTHADSVQSEFEVSTHDIEVLTQDTKTKLLKIDDQVLTHEFKVSTHGDNTYQLKEEGMKC